MRPSTVVALAALLSIAGLAQAQPDLFSAKPLAFKREAGAKVVGAYVPNWEPVAVVDRIKKGSLSHILYAFLRVCGPGALAKDAEICAGKKDFALGTGPKEAEFDAAFLRLKAKDRLPEVKIVASVGGWGGSDPIFHLANDAARRAAFAASVVDFLRTHKGFDGIDIDWEHPGDNGNVNGVQLGSPTDGQGFADLMNDLRRAVDVLGKETGRRYLVTSAVNVTSAIVDRVNFRDSAAALDLLFMMSYDFYGPWSSTVGNHTGLMSSSAAADDGLDRAVRNLTKAGMPIHKLVAGVAMYSRGFSGLKAPVTGTPKSAINGGIFPPGGDASIVYREIAPQMLGPKGEGIKGYKALFDPVTQAWNLWNAETGVFIGYDDPRAVQAKGHYAVSKGMAGVFAWELSQDNGDILNAMNRGVGNSPISR